MNLGSDLDNTSYLKSPFYSRDIGYFGFIWFDMFVVMIFHIWCFQSITKVSKSSIGFCLFQSLHCCRHYAMQKDTNIKNLQKEVDSFNKEQIKKENNKLSIVIIAEDNANKKQNAFDVYNQAKNNNNLGALHVVKNNSLTPYSPSIQSPSESSGDGGNTPDIDMNINVSSGNIPDNPNMFTQHSHSRRFSDLQINLKDLRNIKVVIYDINVLLSIIYIARDAIKSIQNKPVEWMTNKQVQHRLFNFEPNRSDLLRNHFEFIKNTAQRQICVISDGFNENKIKLLIGMLHINGFVDVMYSKDSELWNKERNNISVIILDIMSHFECKNDEVLFISNELDQMRYLKQIDLCSLYPLFQCMEQMKISANLSQQHIVELNKYLLKSSSKQMQENNIKV